MPRTLQLANVNGIAIRFHVSAIVAFLLLLVALVGVYFPSILPEERGPTYWSVGFISTLFLFLSTLAHELGHALMARVRGVPVGAITLVMFSGSSDIDRTSAQPLDEVLISISGPGVSLAVAAAAATARFTIPNQSLPLMGFLELVLILNAWLGLFNLLPTLPLDGGQAIRGLIWHRTHDFAQATRLASILGRGLAGILFAGGAALFIVSLDEAQSPFPSLLGYDPKVVALVIIAVAWFLNSGARNAYRHVVLEQRFRGARIAEIMTPDPSTVAPWTNLDEIVTHHFLQRGDHAVAVVREGNFLMGLVAYADVRKVPRSEWPSRAAGEVMTRTSDLVTVVPGDTVEVAIRHMAQRHFNQLPVVSDGRLVGMIARVNVLRFLDLKELSGEERR